MNWRFVFAASAAFVMSVAATQAGPRDDVLEAIGKCAAIADNTARLACYDALAPQVKTALATPPPLLNHPPTREEQESWFGFNIDRLFSSISQPQTTPQQFGADNVARTAPPAAAEAGQAAAGTAAGAAGATEAAAAPAAQPEAAPEEIDSITATLTDYSYNPFGQFIIFLDNGQVWKQNPGEPNRARFNRDPKDNTVTIERGAFGSYNLTMNGSDKMFKVNRVK